MTIAGRRRRTRRANLVGYWLDFFKFIVCLLLVAAVVAGIAARLS